MGAYLLPLFAFLAGFLAVFAANLVAADLQRRERARMRQRMREEFRKGQREQAKRQLSNRDISQLAMEGLEDDNDTMSFAERFQLWIVQSGLNLSAAKLCAIMFAAATPLGLGTLFLLGNVIVAVLAATIGAGLPLLYVAVKRHTRLEQFRTRLPDVFDLIARIMRAGQTMSQGLQAVGDEFTGPVGAEFAYCYEQQNLGLSTEAALRDLSRRTGLLEIKIFIVAVMVHRQTGGNLAELLEKLATVVRERFRIRGMIKTLTAEGRLQAVILLGLPPAMLLMMLFINYAYTITLFQFPLILLVMFVSMVIGALWIRRIVSFDF